MLFSPFCEGARLPEQASLERPISVGGVRSINAPVDVASGRVKSKHTPHAERSRQEEAAGKSQSDAR